MAGGSASDLSLSRSTDWGAESNNDKDQGGGPLQENRLCPRTEEGGASI